MRRSVAIGDRVRSWVRLACMFAVTVMLAAPLLFGPALAALAHTFGGETHHACACGMEQGRCGCPECERVAQLDDDDDAAGAFPSPRPLLKAGCDDDTRLSPSFAAVTIATLPARESPPPPQVVASSPSIDADALVPRGRSRPPTPPPRITRG